MKQHGGSTPVVFEVVAHAPLEPFLPVVVRQLPQHLKTVAAHVLQPVRKLCMGLHGRVATGPYSIVRVERAFAGRECLVLFARCTIIKQNKAAVGHLFVVGMAQLQTDPINLIERALADEHVVHAMRYPTDIVAPAVGLPHESLHRWIELAPLNQAVYCVDKGRGPKVGAGAEHGGDNA
eukprot:6183481-Pleurochrysis_carterae.AAC.3